MKATHKNFIGSLKNKNKKVVISKLTIVVSIAILFVNTKVPLINSILYSVSIIPLAIILGKETSKISDYIGEKKGGLLSATVGNVPELMMGLWAIRYGMLGMAKAGLLGAVITNMLLGLGIAIFCGGIKFKEQKFNKMIARTNFNMLLLAISAIIIIAALNKYSFIREQQMVNISAIVSILLISIYILGLIFSLYTHSNFFVVSQEKLELNNNDKKETIRIFITLAFITLLLYFTSEKLIENINNIVNQYNVSQEFIGIILIPLLGAFGENASSIVCALNNKIDVSLETAIGSSIQITMFVIPILIISSLFMKLGMTLLFSTFQIIMLVLSMAMSYFVFQDGKTYWLEGGILVTTYVLITIAYYYIV
ncbi:calcium/proton exchanger [Clostridium tunisiense]|uniref:calcium/proton exchanger n=1 Tax=Clostridium tunisiense TaxID=219748 RepID=UPI00031A1D94|nr:calcium/proton exchanger [Clostridium tunisiense]